jgi:hypothetical protein
MRVKSNVSPAVLKQLDMKVGMLPGTATSSLDPDFFSFPLWSRYHILISSSLPGKTFAESETRM